MGKERGKAGFLRAIAFQNIFRSLSRKWSSHPAHLNFSRKEPFGTVRDTIQIHVLQVDDGHTDETKADTKLLRGVSDGCLSGCDLFGRLPPAIFEKIGKATVGCLLGSCVLHFTRFFARDQQPSTIAQAQHQELQPRIGTIGCLKDARKAVEFLRTLKEFVDLLIGSLKYPVSHTISCKASSTRHHAVWL